MQNLFARLGCARVLFRKSEQFQLIDMPVRVGASVDKHGHVHAPFIRIQKVRVEKPAQIDLFGAPDEQPKKERSSRLDAFVAKHGGLSRLAHLMSGLTEGQQQKLFGEMGKLGGKSIEEVSAMFDGIKPEAAADDLFAAPAAIENPNPALFAELREKNSALADRAMEAGNGKLSGNIRGFAIGMKDTDSNLSRKWVDEVIAGYEKLVVSAEKQASKNAGPANEPEKNEQIVEHVTGRGKTLRGIVRTDLTLEQAKAIDEYTFKKDGGYFIREKHLGSMGDVPKAEVVAPVAISADEQKRKVESHKGPIESDDPLAIQKLSHKAEQLQALQDRMKAANKAIKSGNDAKLIEMGFAPDQIAKLKTKDFAGRVGFPDYAITNNGAEIRRAKQRMEGLIKLHQGATKQDEVPKMAPVVVDNEAKVENEAAPEFTLTPSDPVPSQDVSDINVGNIEPFGVSAGISKQARRDLNAQAVAIVNRGAPFTEADKAVLRQYSGNGGCGDSLNEFYTLPEVANAMWAVAQRLGVKGEVLEPSCGPGVYLHTAPANTKVTGVERDEVSAKIAKALHGPRHEVMNASLERFSTQDSRQYDGVLGNVPFGLRGSLIKDDKPNWKTADSYFFDTAMDKCKAGGVVGLIVPTGIMDSKTNRKLRETLARKGQFLGAQRMPNTAFEHSHTEVTTDVVWFRKFPDDVAGALSTKAITQDQLKALGLWDEEFLSGGYFAGRGASNVLGKTEAGWRAKAGMGADITVEGSMNDVPAAIRDFIPEETKPFPAVTDILAAVAGDEKAKAVVLGGAMTRPYADKSKVGDTKNVDGIAYVLQGKPPRWHRIDEVLQSEALTQGQDIAARIEALMSGMSAVDRPKLEADLRAWVDEHGIPAKNQDILLGTCVDKTLHRLIGAVKSNGDLSDVVLGKVATQNKGSFETTIQSLLNDHDTVGVDALSKAAELDKEEALDQLYGSPKYAVDAVTGEWTTKDIYLSGDLWAKSDAVKAVLAGDGLAPELRRKLEQQDAMLTEAIAPVSLEDAFIELNSAFVPTSIISAFLDQRYKAMYTHDKNPEQIVLSFGEGIYTMTGGKWAYDKLMKYLNRDGFRLDDKPAIDAMNVEFKDWLCASTEYRPLVEDLYNRKFKGFQEREFSNEPMDIPGMNTEGLKDYQWGGLRWALNSGKGIIAADVGLGKTARALMLARVLKTSGQAKRPMIVVPKSVLSNWVAECEKWFPGSSVLTIGDEGDDPVERNRKLHDLQQNDYDFIIVSDPQFAKIDLDPVTKGELNSKDFWNQRGDSLEHAGDKRKNAIKTQWEQALANQTFDENMRTKATYFNDLGVDALIVDEFHHVKNLCTVGTRFGEQPKYMGGGATSMRALDFNLKSRWLLNDQGNKNVYGLTATPTKNSPIEIYAMLSHVAPEAMEKIGIRNSEEFIDRFAKIEQGIYQATNGLMEEGQIVAGFHNMDELRSIMTRFIHRQTADQVGLVLPKRQEVLHMIDMDEEQEAKYVELREMLKEAGGKDATGDAHIFSIMDKMNKAAMDMSLLDASYDGKKSPKYKACAAAILENMKDGGQIVFSDYNDSHEKMADALVAAGIPRDQIGILNGKKTPSPEKRQAMCDKFNAGKIKVVIGNTRVMGEGLNLQKGTSDIHHLDLPWEPASMQQRNGRGLRQGNTNAGVRIHNYLAKGSFDGYRLQAILAKKDWQDMIWNGGNEVENLNKAGSISREEMAIMLSADPDKARALYEANSKGKEAQLVAGKTMEAAKRFSKFQELKRSYTALQNKQSQSSERLKVKLDKEYATLKADKYFTAKQALDIDTPVIVADSGVILQPGAGVELGEGADAYRYIVTGVNQRGQTVTVRKYGDENQTKREVDVKELAKTKAFAYDQAAETAEINKRIAEQPLEIKSLSDVNKLPASVIASNYAKLQEQIWQGVTDYKISLSSLGRVPMIEKSTGKAVIADSYSIGAGKEEFNQAKYDFMLPTEENKAKAAEAWKDARRNAILDTKHVKTGNRRSQKYETHAVREYPESKYDSKSVNPWSRTIDDFSGNYRNGAYHYGAGMSPDVKVVREKFDAEQLDRVRHAKTFSEAINAAASLGKIADATQGYSAKVKMPKRALALLWAKAKHEGALGDGMSKHSAKHSPYYVGGSNRSVHSALLAMAVNSGHEDLAHAMVESGLRHHAGGNHSEALQALAEGHGHGKDRVAAMQKLATAAGLNDTKRRDLSYEWKVQNGPLTRIERNPYGYASQQPDQTIGEALGAMMQKHNEVTA